MITAAPNAPIGSVVRLSSYDEYTFPPTSAILCRNTAPLIAFAFSLLQRQIACHVVGRDIQVGLEKLLDKVAAPSKNRNETQIRLKAHSDAEVKKLILKGKKEQAANYQDKCTVLALFIDRTDGSLDDVKVAINRLFASGDGVTLSTIHKAKGLEWPTVFLLDWFLLPSRYAETADAKTQERNLQYVAVTRAKLDLRFIESGCWTNNK